jgi:adenylate kinase
VSRRLLILGPPGAGKGTQAALVCKALGIPHVSTGEMLRDHVARGTELGQQAKLIMDAGDLVSDQIVIAMVEERLAQPDAACGFLLDGFPRTAPQAGALEDVIAENPLDGVIVLEVPEDEIVDRTLARGRSDDTAESVRTRLARYHEQTAPLISFYEARGDMARVDGVGTIDEVLARIVGALAR